MFSSAAIPSHQANEHLLLLGNWKGCNFGRREQNNHFAEKKSQSAIVSPNIGTHKPNIQIENKLNALFGVPPFQIVVPKTINCPVGLLEFIVRAKATFASSFTFPLLPRE
ncbi:hypothetical protein niasHS_015089 [Heterodera schachtii]|uniref:Uncharacterized protein n=2 Tax=Heterodera TaxID=34509 RepID=A0ABD2I2G0_HETSC